MSVYRAIWDLGDTMATRIHEFHGYAPLSPMSRELAGRHWCPFVDAKCKKKFGACSLSNLEGATVMICPNRLYAASFTVLDDIADRAFGLGHSLLSRTEAKRRKVAGQLSGKEIAVFGQGFDGEISIPAPKEPGANRSGRFKIDFVLARLTSEGEIADFAAVEVQTIDTTSSYKDAGEKLMAGEPYVNSRGGDTTKAGFNWENVTKRILPQIIYKGHTLRREPLCTKGLFFILPQAVYERIKVRIGGDLLEHPVGSGTVTFVTYELSDESAQPTPLRKVETFTTTVDQIAYAFVSPRNLPGAGSYASAIDAALL